jgi:hypothetical protein
MVVLFVVRVRGPSLVGRPPMAISVADTVTVNGWELASEVSVVVTMTPAVCVGQHGMRTYFPAHFCCVLHHSINIVNTG